MKQGLLPGLSLPGAAYPVPAAEPTFTFSDEPDGRMPDATPHGQPSGTDRDTDGGTNGRPNGGSTSKGRTGALNAPAESPSRVEEQVLLPGFSLVAQVDSLHVFSQDRHPLLPPIIVIGLGPGPNLDNLDSRLSPEARQALEEAEVLAASRPLLKGSPVLHIPLASPLEEALDMLEEQRRQGRRCVVLADGDPLLYGIGATLARRLPADALRILPGVSAMQTACARLALPWHDMTCMSLHGRDDWTALSHAVLTGKPVCVYTDARHTPGHIARFLLERGVDWYRMTVAKALGLEQESVKDWSLQAAAEQDFTGGETALLLPAAPVRGPRLGLDERGLVLDGGLYTKAPVRAAALSLLNLSPTSVMWDIGAGSGCLSLEAAALTPRGRVIAVEQYQDRALCIRENRRRLGIPHLDVITAFAPLGLDALPDPNAVFLGGGLGGSGPGDADFFASPLQSSALSDQATQSSLLLHALFARLRPGGTLVAACSLLSSLQFFTTYLQSHGLLYDVTLVQASVSSPLAGSLTLKGQNPIFLVRTHKNEDV